MTPATHAQTAGERALIRVRSIYLGATAIMTIFLGLYLFHVGGIVPVATFYAAYYPFVLVGFLLAARVLATRSTRTVMRAGATAVGVVYLLLLVLGPAAVGYALVIGALAGIGEGLFWAGQNLTEYRITSGPTRSLYLGRADFAAQLTATLAPPLAGAMLTLAAMFLPGDGRYYLLFGLLAGVLLVVRRTALSLPRVGGVDFRLSDLRQDLREPGWLPLLGQQFVRGMWQTVSGVFTPILVFLVVRGELAVSFFAAGSTLLSAFTALVAGRVLHRRPEAYVVGVVAVPVGLLALALGQNWLSLAAYVLLVTCLDHFARIRTNSAAYTLMDRLRTGGGGDYHLFVHREIALNAGRLCSLLLVLALAGSGEELGAVTLGIVLVSSMPLVAGVLQARLERALAAPEAVPGGRVADEPVLVAA